MNKFLSEWTSRLVASGFKIEKAIEIYPDRDTWNKLIDEIEIDRRYQTFVDRGTPFKDGIVYFGSVQLNFIKPRTKAQKLKIIQDEINAKMKEYQNLEAKE